MLVEEFLELGSGFAPLMRSQIGFSSHEHRVQSGPTENAGGRYSSLIRCGDSKTTQCFRSISLAKRKLCVKGRKVIELHDCVLRKPLAQIVNQTLYSPVVPRIRQGDRSAVLHISGCRTLHCQSGSPSCFTCVAKQCLSQTRLGRVTCGRFLLLCSFGGVHCSPGKLSGLSEPPGIGIGPSFQSQQPVLYSGLARRPCDLLRHAFDIALQESNLI